MWYPLAWYSSSRTPGAPHALLADLHDLAGCTTSTSIPRKTTAGVLTTTVQAISSATLVWTTALALATVSASGTQRLCRPTCAYSCACTPPRSPCFCSCSRGRDGSREGAAPHVHVGAATNPSLPPSLRPRPRHLCAPTPTHPQPHSPPHQPGGGASVPPPTPSPRYCCDTMFHAKLAPAVDAQQMMALRSPCSHSRALRPASRAQPADLDCLWGPEPHCSCQPPDCLGVLPHSACHQVRMWTPTRSCK